MRANFGISSSKDLDNQQLQRLVNILNGILEGKKGKPSESTEPSKSEENRLNSQQYDAIQELKEDLPPRQFRELLEKYEVVSENDLNVTQAGKFILDIQKKLGRIKKGI